MKLNKHRCNEKTFVKKCMPCILGVCSTIFVLATWLCGDKNAAVSTWNMNSKVNSFLGKLSDYVLFKKLFRTSFVIFFDEISQDKQILLIWSGCERPQLQHTCGVSLLLFGSEGQDSDTCWCLSPDFNFRVLSSDLKAAHWLTLTPFKFGGCFYLVFFKFFFAVCTCEGISTVWKKMKKNKNVYCENIESTCKVFHACNNEFVYVLFWCNFLVTCANFKNFLLFECN